MEEDETLGSRYRDHYVHMFDVFITGARIISLIISSLPSNINIDNFIKELFKVTKEPDRMPFPKAYSAKQRLFFLWTIMATFHDIGIPVEHLNNIKFGLNKYLRFFGLELEDFHLNSKANVGLQIQYYLKLISYFFEAGIRPNNDFLYDKALKVNPYLYHALVNEYGERKSWNTKYCVPL